MTLKESLHTDLAAVFLNLDEFAEERIFNGLPLVCIVDDDESTAVTGASGGLKNASGLGLLHCDRRVLCKAADFPAVPQAGERVEMDGCRWFVGDGVTVCEGLLTLPLNRAY